MFLFLDGMAGKKRQVTSLNIRSVNIKRLNKTINLKNILKKWISNKMWLSLETDTHKLIERKLNNLQLE